MGSGPDGQGRRQPAHRQEATEAIARRFFDFFEDVPHGMQGLKALCGQAGGWLGPTIPGNSFGTGPHFGKNYPHKTSFFDDSSAKWTSWGLGKLFFRPSMSKA